MASDGDPGDSGGARLNTPIGSDGRLAVALITEVFHGDTQGAEDGRLRQRLTAAREAGADLAVLPELPLDPWVPAGPEPSDDDAEPPGGPRHQRLSEAARGAGVALLGGAIVRDPSDGHRYNTALLFDAEGRLTGTYRKLHIPDEEGFREACHYRPGSEPPGLVGDLPIPTGVQICSDINRPENARLLAALGAGLILVPRATPGESYERWLLVLRAAAVTCAAYVISVNRPATTGTVPIGGPSVAIDPLGRVLVESDEALALAELDADQVARAREEYPGYLATHPDVVARGWGQVTPP